MQGEVAILIAEAMFFYFLVLWAHSLRRRFGLAHFYALLGGLTAVMSWVTDAGITVDVHGVSFVVGSTVFYTSLLLGVFVIYVFDGPRATRIAISTVAGVSLMVPVIAAVLHVQVAAIGAGAVTAVPLPSLRTNLASVLTTIADLLFLAVSWEFLGKPALRMPLWTRSYLTLLGVMWLDVLLFATGAFLGTPSYLRIMAGTLSSRLAISLVAFPFLYLYLNWQNRLQGSEIQSRPVLAILKEVNEMRLALGSAREEIEHRRRVEEENRALIEELRSAMAEVKTLRGILPICAGCKKVRTDEGSWQQIEEYIRAHSDAVFSHGYCPECLEIYFPRTTRS